MPLVINDDSKMKLADTVLGRGGVQFALRGSINTGTVLKTRPTAFPGRLKEQRVKARTR